MENNKFGFSNGFLSANMVVYQSNPSPAVSVSHMGVDFSPNVLISMQLPAEEDGTRSWVLIAM